VTLRRGPRPLAIRAFAALFLLQAGLSFWHQISHLAETEAVLASVIPQLAVDRDVAIVVTSARLTIAFIPLALIWFLGSRFARIFVLLMLAGRLLTLGASLNEASPSPAEVASLLLAIAAVVILLSPGAAGWFRKQPKPARD